MRFPLKIKQVFFCAFLFLTLAIPFKQLTNLIPGTEIRPFNVIPPVFGLLFGAEAAWGTAIGNLVADILFQNTFTMFGLGFLTNFLFSYLPYKMWYGLKLGQKEITPPNINTLAGLLKFIYIIFMDSAVTTGALVMIFEMAGLKAAKDSVWLLFLNNFDFAILLGIPILCLASNWNVQPNFPNAEKKIRLPFHESCLDILLFFALGLEAAFVIYSAFTNGAFQPKLAKTVYCLATGACFLYLLKPVKGRISIRSRNDRPAFSIKAKVTIGFLLVSVVFIFFTGAAAYQAVTMDPDKTRLEVWSYIYQVVGIAINLIFAAAVLFLWYVERYITTPLEQLSDLVRQYGRREGDKAETDSRIREGCSQIRTRDEIGALAAAFGKMTRDIDSYVRNLAAVTADRERIAAELGVASRIQASMLPCIFPPFPDCDRLDLYAVMLPAKEVGGDFYDFFFVDSSHFAFVMADVSGKGVPAALFMVIAKTLIKNHAQSGEQPWEVFTNVNRQLCENNEEGLFVTAWMGILDLDSGTLSYVNAGHEPPFIKRENGSFWPLPCHPLLVLAGMEHSVYCQEETTLENGDMLFLCTDGVTEAMDTCDRLYGKQRLKEQLNLLSHKKLKEILQGIKTDIDGFTENAPQFDDITMLLLKINKEERP